MSTKQLLSAAAALLSVVCMGADIFIPKLDGTVTLDGIGDDKLWQQSASISSFERLGSGDQAKDQTDIKAFHNGKSLFVLFRCKEKNPEKLVAKAGTRDRFVFHDDCVEILVSSLSNGEPYYHFIVNSLGVVGDAKITQKGFKHDSSWDGSWTAAAAKTADGYNVEMEIPVKNFPRPDSQTWRILFARENKVSGELSSFPGIRGNSFHTPDAFAIMNGMNVDLSEFPFEANQCNFVFDKNVNSMITGSLSIDFSASIPVAGKDLTLLLTDSENGMYSKQFADKTFPAGKISVDFPVKLLRQGAYTVELLYKNEKIGKWNKRFSGNSFHAELTYPRYRNYIFDSMKLKNLKLAITGLSGKKQNATIQLCTEDGKTIGDSIQTIIQQSPGQIVIPLPEQLPYGKYSLKVSSGSETQTIAITKIAIPAGTPEVWFDPENNLVVNGETIFPFGFYYNPPAAGEFVSSKCNTLVDVRGDLNRFDHRKIGLFAYARGLVDGSFIKGKPQTKLNESELKVAEKLFRGKYPNVWGWYVADEPELFTHNPALYREGFRKLLALSPDRPLLTTHNALSGLEFDADLADIISFDPYLGFEKNTKRPLISYERIAIYFSTASKDLRGRKPLWAILQCFSSGYYGSNPEKGRFPTAREMRLMSYLAVIHGARGVIFWRDDLLATSKLWANVKALADEFSVMKPFLLAPDTHKPIQRGTVHLLRRDAGGQSCFIVANIGDKEERFELNSGYDGSLHVLSEERTVDSKQGKAQLTLPPYSLQILLTGKLPETKFASVIKNEKEEDSWVGTPVAGNLASFWSGAKPIASSTHPYRTLWSGNDDNYIYDWICNPGDTAPWFGVELSPNSTVGKIDVTAEHAPESIEIWNGNRWEAPQILQKTSGSIGWNDHQNAWVDAQKDDTAEHVKKHFTFLIAPVKAEKIRVKTKQLNELRVFENGKGGAL